MKILGVDFGTKRIGLAISDDGGTLAFPKEVILNDQKGLERIEQIIKEEKVVEIVIGESMNFSGEKNKVMVQAEKFFADCEKLFMLPTHWQKEFLTSVEAHGRKGKEANNARPINFKKPEQLDASAAALILQRYLDKRNNMKSI